ncbi:unnamed protein product, partial [marine sediment metagenome]
MSVKVTVNLDLFKKLIPDIKKDFKNNASRPIGFAILKDILRGVSPVKGQKWRKYSESYKGQIRGDITFRKIGGKIVPFKRTKRGPKIDTVPRKEGKKISPVNMKLTGAMLRSFFIDVKGANIFSKPLKMIIGFNSKL